MSERTISNIRLIPYGRVSSDEQFEKGNSIPEQLEQCIKYIASIGAIATEPITDSVSGTILNRKGLTHVREMLRNREAEGIVVFRNDRLSRKLAHLLILKEEFTRLGAQIHYVNRGQSLNTPSDHLMDNVEGAFGEYWREKIIEDSTNGRNRKAMRGKFVGCGSPPYGYAYDVVQDLLFVNKQTAEVVVLIYTWYTIGDVSNDEGPLTARRIAIRLTQMQKPTPGYHRQNRIHAPNIWSPTTVSAILRNETYCGTWHWGKYCTVHDLDNVKVRTKRPVADWIAVPVTPIISREMWEAAQNMKRTNFGEAGRNKKNFYMLSGMIVCGRCGRGYQGLSYKRHRKRTKEKLLIRYYECATRHHLMSGVEKHCGMRMINADWAEQKVWEWINKLLHDDEAFEEGIRKTQEQIDNMQNPVQDRLVIIANLLVQYDDQLASLAEAVGNARKGSPAHAALQNRMSQVEKIYDDLVAERNALEERIKTLITKDQVEAVRVARRQTALGLKNATPGDKREAMKLMNTKITVNEDGLVVTCAMAIEPLVIPHREVRQNTGFNAERHAKMDAQRSGKDSTLFSAEGANFDQLSVVDNDTYSHAAKSARCRRRPP